MPRVKAAPIPRIFALDYLRGYFLISIVLTHLWFWPSGYDWLNIRGELFISSAEGFFLISGIVLGMVRGRKLIEKPFKTGARLLLNRAFQLYAVYVVLGLAFTFAGWQFLQNPGLKAGIIDPSTPILQVIWQMISFQYLYGWVDYLRLYALFLLIAPIFLLLLRRNLWWLGLIISVAIWAITPNPTWPDSVYLQPYHWQLLFFAGMALGFHWPEVSNVWTKQTIATKRLVVGGLISATVLTLAFNIFLAFGGYISSAVADFVTPLRSDWRMNYFDKENLPLPRLLLFMLWFWTAFWFFTRFTAQLQRWFGWILQPFGTNSLYVYIVHGILVFSVHLFVAPGSKNLLLNFTLTTLVLAIIWLMIRYKVLFRIIPR